MPLKLTPLTTNDIMVTILNCQNCVDQKLNLRLAY